jgi:hypothetical protein
MAGWASAPGRTWHARGRRVAVDWFQTSGGRLVRILGADNQRIDLLLILSRPTQCEIGVRPFR